MYKIILIVRYLLKKRLSYLSFSAVCLCVFVVVVVMTVMTGLVSDFKQKNHQFVGDCVVATDSMVGFPYYEDFIEVLRQTPFVQAVSPVIKSCALVTPRGSQRGVGVEIMGIDPGDHALATGFAETLHHRRTEPARAFEPAYDPNLPGCVVGIDLWFERSAASGYPYEAAPSRTALSINCFPLTAKGALAGAGAGIVNTKTFYYSDSAHTGLAQVDGSLIYLPFEQAQRLCGMAGPIKRINAIHILFTPAAEPTLSCRKVALLWRNFTKNSAGRPQAALLQNVTVQSWKQYRRSFIAAMETEQTMMIVMFVLVGITTVFIVFVVFYMIVSHKSKDIGILKSLGVPGSQLMSLFSGFACSIGLLGSLLGCVAGYLFLENINRIEHWLFEHFNFQLWDRTIYAIEDIPNRLEWHVLAVIVLSAILVCLAGAFLPGCQAAAAEPAETLQVNQL